MRRFLFTSESVTEGHPDKIADQISDGILDAILAKDPLARVAAETLVTTGLALVAGEISAQYVPDIVPLVRDVVRGIGYVDPRMGFDAETCAVLTSLDEQSPDIAGGVFQPLEAREGERPEELGAGDQGMMFGYACDETPELMPLPISLAHRLARRLAEVRRSPAGRLLWPDGKTQVTVEYEGDRPIRLHTVVVSAQHRPEATRLEVENLVRDEVIRPVVPPALYDDATRVLVNPSGRFVVGGPHGDTGLTGRKIIADTYGGYARHGGGAFSGKDPTKVDRSAAYAARWAAKNVVGAGLARRCEIQLAYAIGVAHPVSVSVDTFGTGQMRDEEIARIVAHVFDFRPRQIIARLDLRRPIYRQVSVYGHFGRTDLDLPWERLDRVEALRQAALSADRF